MEIIAEVLARAKERLRIADYQNRFIYDDLFRSWHYAHIGDSSKVAAWLRRETDQSELNSLIRGIDLIISAKYFYMEKNYASALAMLDASRSTAGSFVFGRIEAEVLASLCLYKSGSRQEAYEALKKAWEAAAPGGYILPFVEAGKDMRALTSAALKEKAPIPADFLEKIRIQASAYAKKYYLIREEIIKFRGGGKDAEPRGAKTAFSDKELDVLNGLFQGFTQDEIALSTKRSVNTIKSTVKRIYDKLGAVNRADAIRIAMSQGILDYELSEGQESAALEQKPPAAGQPTALSPPPPAPAGASGNKPPPGKRSLIPGIQVRP
jgi:LuxR family maltose regulon positive regulatory protein